MTAPRLELTGISKQYPAVKANDNISLRVQPGEIHALLGENGAGKSTLVRQLFGLYKPDEGKILVNGKEMHFNSPMDAISAGIGMIHQHFMLVPSLTVRENVAFGLTIAGASPQEKAEKVAEAARILATARTEADETATRQREDLAAEVRSLEDSRAKLASDIAQKV